MKKAPLVTIIMATYNRAHFIVETLQSIEKQTFLDWECLILDDGGVDNTLELISPILENDKRFQYLERPATYKKGLPGCRNYGLDLAKGDYIIFFDDDDIVHPQNLELCVVELINTSYTFCRYERSVFFEDFDYKYDFEMNYGKFEITVNDIGKMIDGSLPFNSCAIMWQKDCFLKNRFEELLMYAEEWELYSRLLSENIRGVSIEKTLFYGRKHKNSNTGEFYNNDPIRIASKKEAIRLVTENLMIKHLLTKTLLKYLTGLAISFRDAVLLNEILDISKTRLKIKLYLKLKFYMFPLWKIYKRALKIIGE